MTTPLSDAVRARIIAEYHFRLGPYSYLKKATEINARAEDELREALTGFSDLRSAAYSIQPELEAFEARVTALQKKTGRLDSVPSDPPASLDLDRWKDSTYRQGPPTPTAPKTSRVALDDDDLPVEPITAVVRKRSSLF